MCVYMWGRGVGGTGGGGGGNGCVGVGVLVEMGLCVCVDAVSVWGEWGCMFFFFNKTPELGLTVDLKEYSVILTTSF